MADQDAQSAQSGPKDLYRVDDLSKSYGKLKVLDHLSFTVVQRECFVIMGRSGTGKSVTLRLLNGLESPDSGSIVLEVEIHCP